MPTEIKMPQLGESVVEGTISRWLKKPGERVEKYEALLEVMTDKVDTEVPAPEAGVLSEIVIPEGETVRVGTLIALLNGGVDDRQPTTDDRQPTTDDRQPTTDHRPPTAETAFVSPVVARLAAEHAIDLSQIHGTGQGGRVSKKDVLRYLDQRGSTTADKRQGEKQASVSVESVDAAPVVAAFNTPAQEASEQTRGQGSVVRGQEDKETGGQGDKESTHTFQTTVPRPQFPHPTSQTAQSSTLSSVQRTTDELPEDAELVPLSPMRRIIAEHMERSVREAPHVTTVIEVDVGAAALHRAKHKAEFERQGVNLTFTAYFAQAVCAALRAVPIVNGSFTPQGIVQHGRIHLGIAVALDEGLIVPVIRDADEKNLLGLARTVNDIAARARVRRLRPEETQDGTFTITNHGVSGSLFATPIINQPQGAILGIGAIQKRAVVVTQNGVDAIAIRPMCYLSLTFDHRLMDGATADSFLVAVKRALEV